MVRRTPPVMRFPDRRVAGELLATLVDDAIPTDPVVLALPRGGVPVGYEVANVLQCQMDVLVVRKLGVPTQPELAMGAIGEAGVVVRNEQVVDVAGVNGDEFERVLLTEQDELERRVANYRELVDPIDPAGLTAVIVDDGLATGSTAAAGIAVVRKREAKEVWLAVPVAPAETVRAMERLVDRVVVLAQPSSFGSVGFWYRDFGQTTDAEVRNLLEESRLR